MSRRVARGDFAWFKSLLALKDKSEQLKWIDSHCRYDPEGMGNLFGAVMEGSGWSDSDRAVASYFWKRGRDQGVWSHEPELYVIAAKYIGKLLEDNPNADDAEYLE